MSIFSSFFASAWYLLFLPLTLLPLVIYLFNRRKNRKISFSSNFFLKKVKSSSIRKINIINILLLVIRTLLILFFILMLAKPKNLFVSNELDFSSTAKIYIYVDDTYSMNDEIKTRLFETINSIFKLHNTDDYVEIIYSSYNNLIFNDQIKLFDSNVLNESAAFISNIFINPVSFRVF